jgi:serine protease Do
MSNSPDDSKQQFNEQNSIVDKDYESSFTWPNAQNYTPARESDYSHNIKQVQNLSSQTQVKQEEKITTQNQDIKPATVAQNDEHLKNKDSGLSSIIWTVLMALVLAIFTAAIGGASGFYLANRKFQETVLQTQVTNEITTTKTVEEESATVDVAKNSRDSVVSVIISKKFATNTPQNNRSTNQSSSIRSRQIGAGSGFIVSKEGFIVTNKHVVEDTDAEYTVAFDDKEIIPAKVLARDTLLDIAILKIETEKTLKPIPLGDSDRIQVGQTVIAIGNSLGEFSNTVSKGIISGLARTIVASDQNNTSTEILEDIIQTDASINPGNSGGPLLDIGGNVIGVNVARAQNGENIGFTLPINSVKFVLESVIKTGKIERPFLGVSYTDLTPEIAKENNLNTNYGAFVNAQTQDEAVVKDSAADKAGIKSGDVILEINNQKLEGENTLRKIIQKFKVGDTITLKILRDSKQIELKAVLTVIPS